MGRVILGTATLLIAVLSVLASSPGAAAAAATCERVEATIDDHTGKIVGTDGDDVLIGNNGANTILGKGGDDLIRSGGGDDVIRGGHGDDDLYGGTVSAEPIHYPDGNDTIEGGPGDGIIFGDAGYDTLGGGAGTDFCAQDGNILLFCDGGIIPESG